MTEWVELYLYAHYAYHDVERNNFIHIKHCVQGYIQAVVKKDLNFLACRDSDLAQYIPYPNHYTNYATLQQARHTMYV